MRVLTLANGLCMVVHMSNTATTTKCRKCNGTGHRPEVAHVDGGRCWACGPQEDHSYVHRYDNWTEADHEAERAKIRAEMVADQARRRIARRAALA